VDLEAKAQLQAEACPACGSGVVSSSNRRSRPGGKADDRGGFAGDHFQVVIRRDILTRFKAQIERLSLHDLDRHAFECVEDGEGALCRNSTRRQLVQRQVGHREEGIPGIDRLFGAPRVPDRGPMATSGALILDVVVNQGEVVE
jgi:hypothetical protein